MALGFTASFGSAGLYSAQAGRKLAFGSTVKGCLSAESDLTTIETALYLFRGEETFFSLMLHAGTCKVVPSSVLRRDF